MTSERIEEAALELTTAVQAMDCALSMLDKMPVGSTVDSAGLVKLLLPVFGNISAALESVSG